MGHAPRQHDMIARYRERISDERLRAVVDHVHPWLAAGSTLEHPVTVGCFYGLGGQVLGRNVLAGNWPSEFILRIGQPGFGANCPLIAMPLRAKDPDVVSVWRSGGAARTAVFMRSALGVKRPVRGTTSQKQYRKALARYRLMLRRMRRANTPAKALEHLLAYRASLKTR